MQNENLMVNSKTDILEFKRKHNLLVGKGTIKTTVSNIKQMTNADIENLSCGDVVLKEDSSGKHAYLVSFKSNTGLCLTYCDASCVETQSYDKVGDNWQYNSEDLTYIAEPRMENIVDKDGHKRFIEGDIDLVDGLTGFTQKYGRWSLSGTHLLIVVAFDIANATTFAGAKICEINIPEWVYNKIIPLYSPVNGVISNYGVKGYNEDFTNQEVGVFLNKQPNKPLSITFNGVTTTKDRSFRIAFDLLIDNE